MRERTITMNLHLESLENRITPASIEIGGSSNSVLIIRDSAILNVNSINQNLITINGTNYNVPSSIRNINVYGSNYNDSINLKNSNKVCFVDGGNGNDVIIGSNNNDLLWGGIGNDTISGEGGNDQVAGGPGNDKLFGNDGNDNIDGGSGNDLIVGGKGVDKLVAYDCSALYCIDEVWTDDIGVRASVFADLVYFNRGLDWINGYKRS